MHRLRIHDFTDPHTSWLLRLYQLHKREKVQCYQRLRCGSLLKWFIILPCLQDEAIARAKLAPSSQSGRDVKKPSVESYRENAEHGDPESQFHLGMALLRGVGVQRDGDLAFEWIRKAAEQGVPDAFYALGACYSDGIGTKQSNDEALQWFLRARDSGHPLAAIRLAKLDNFDITGSKMKSSFEMNYEQNASIRMIDIGSLRPPFKLLAASTFGQAVRCSLVEDEASQDVVVKVPRDPRISEEWVNEWLAMSALPRHENVMQLLGLCERFQCIDGDGEQLCPPVSFVSKFFNHGSIVDYFSKPEHAGHGVLYVSRWTRDIAKGLAHLHAHCCVHRDLAARNVFLGEDMRCVVGDLGLARQFRPDDGAFVSEGKSRAYPLDAAPQVLTDLKYSPASDIFTLGLTMFEIVTECQHSDLFTWNTSLASPAQLFEQFRAASAAGYPNLLAKIPSRVPRDITELMLRCLHFDELSRPTAGEVAAMLEDKVRKERQVCDTNCLAGY